MIQQGLLKSMEGLNLDVCGIEYHKSTGRVKQLYFEEIEELN